jgi:hypothetical protein
MRGWQDPGRHGNNLAGLDVASRNQPQITHTRILCGLEFYWRLFNIRKDVELCPQFLL